MCRGSKGLGVLVLGLWGCRFGVLGPPSAPIYEPNSYTEACRSKTFSPRLLGNSNHEEPYNIAYWKGPRIHE